MNINHEIITNAFTLENEYNDVEKAYYFSDDKSEGSAYSIFIEALLEKHNLIEYVGDYCIKDDDIDDIESTLRAIGKCYKEAGKKPTLDIHDDDNGEYRVFTYLKSDENNIKEALSLSALKYYFDNEHMHEVENDLEEKLEKYKDEAELAKDPYAYYGVKRSDFY